MFRLLDKLRKTTTNSSSSSSSPSSAIIRSSKMNIETRSIDSRPKLKKSSKTSKAVIVSTATAATATAASVPMVKFKRNKYPSIGRDICELSSIKELCNEETLAVCLDKTDNGVDIDDNGNNDDNNDENGGGSDSVRSDKDNDDGVHNNNVRENLDKGINNTTTNTTTTIAAATAAATTLAITLPTTNGYDPKERLIQELMANQSPPKPIASPPTIMSDADDDDDDNNNTSIPTSPNSNYSIDLTTTSVTTPSTSQISLTYPSSIYNIIVTETNNRNDDDDDRCTRNLPTCNASNSKVSNFPIDQKCETISLYDNVSINNVTDDDDDVDNVVIIDDNWCGHSVYHNLVLPPNYQHQQQQQKRKNPYISDDQTNLEKIEQIQTDNKDDKAFYDKKLYICQVSKCNCSDCLKLCGYSGKIIDINDNNDDGNNNKGDDDKTPDKPDNGDDDNNTTTIAIDPNEQSDPYSNIQYISKERRCGISGFDITLIFMLIGCAIWYCLMAYTNI